MWVTGKAPVSFNPYCYHHCCRPRRHPLKRQRGIQRPQLQLARYLTQHGQPPHELYPRSGHLVVKSQLQFKDDNVHIHRCYQRCWCKLVAYVWGQQGMGQCKATLKPSASMVRKLREKFGFEIEILFQLSPPPMPSVIIEMMPTPSIAPRCWSIDWRRRWQVVAPVMICCVQYFSSFQHCLDGLAAGGCCLTPHKVCNFWDSPKRAMHQHFLLCVLRAVWPVNELLNHLPTSMMVYTGTLARYITIAAPKQRECVPISLGLKPGQELPCARC